MDRRFRLKFDLSDFSSFTIPTIRFSVMDSNSSVLLVEILNEGKKTDISNCDIIMYISKPDGKEVLLSGVKESVEEGLVRFNLPAQATVFTSDNYNAEIRILKYGKCVVSRSFNYSVVDNLSGGDVDIISSSEYETLTNLIRDVREIERIEDIRQNDENTRKNNENVRIDNENTRKVSENERIENENKRKAFIEELRTFEQERARIFNSLAPEQSANAEVQLARVDISGLQHESLKDRLDKIERQPSVLWESIEG